jgi:acyl carrier protein
MPGNMNYREPYNYLPSQVDMKNVVEIKDAIKDFIVETTFTPRENIQDDTLIFVQGVFDSMGFISLINFIEEKFLIRAEDADLLEENFESVNAIASFVKRKLN